MRYKYIHPFYHVPYPDYDDSCEDSDGADWVPDKTSQRLFTIISATGMGAGALEMVHQTCCTRAEDGTRTMQLAENKSAGDVAFAASSGAMLGLSAGLMAGVVCLALKDGVADLFQATKNGITRFCNGGDKNKAPAPKP